MWDRMVSPPDTTGRMPRTPLPEYRLHVRHDDVDEHRHRHRHPHRGVPATIEIVVVARQHTYVLWGHAHARKQKARWAKSMTTV